MIHSKWTAYPNLVPNFVKMRYRLTFSRLVNYGLLENGRKRKNGIPGENAIAASVWQKNGEAWTAAVSSERSLKGFVVHFAFLKTLGGAAQNCPRRVVATSFWIQMNRTFMFYKRHCLSLLFVSIKAVNCFPRVCDVTYYGIRYEVWPEV